MVIITKIKEMLNNKKDNDKTKTNKEQNRELNKYLSKFNCMRCNNHCYLDAIRCGGGERDRSAKIKEFNEINNKNNI